MATDAVRTDAFRCDVFSADQLARLAAAPLPLGIAASPAVRSLHRDLHLDTPDGTLARRGVACRLRLSTDDRHPPMPVAAKATQKNSCVSRNTHMGDSR